MAGLLKAFGCLVALMFMAGQAASADEFADVDPARLAEGVERLAAAWRIPIVVHDGATDDFAATPPESLAVARLAPPPSPDPAAAELGYADEPIVDDRLSADILGEIKRRRR